MSDSTLRKSVYEIITDRILSLLDQGTIPWKKPWGGQEQAPRSLATRKHYRGVNVFLLHAAGYESPYWLTYRQAQELGGHIRKGEKGWPVVFWKWREAADAEEVDTEQEGEKRHTGPILRYFTVFNVSQCEALPADKLPVSEQPSEHSFTPIEQAEAIVQGYQSAPRIEHGHAGAWYRPSADLVGMPSPERFTSPAEYYSTLFHELAHSTGHASRLARKGITDDAHFGDRSYSQEELLAELTACYLQGHCHLEQATLANSAAYINAWRQRLKADSRVVVFAAAQAQRAADLILGHSAASDSE
jgi:antirestriction protein ArdC